MSLALIVQALACADDGEVGPERAAPVIHNAEPAGTHVVRTVRSEAPPPKTPPPPDRATSARAVTPLPEVTARVVERSPWRTAKPSIRTLPVRATSVWIGDPDPIGSRFVVSTGRRYDGEASDHFLVDVAAGTQLAGFDREGSTSATAAVVVTVIDDHPVIVHADDGEVVRPVVSLPGGAKPEEIRIVASERDPAVWIFAKAPGGSVYHGHWSDLRTAEVALTAELPFWPKYASGRWGVEAQTSTPSPDGCWQYRFTAGDPPQCTDHGEEPPFTSLPSALTGPWRTRGRWDVSVFNDETESRYEVIPGCEPVEVTRLPIPSRVLGLCSNREGSTVELGVWSPEKTWVYEGALALNGIHLGSNREGPVASVEGIANYGAPTRRWIDLEHGRLVHTPTLHRLVWADTFGFEHRVLGLGSDGALWLLDIDAGTLERIVEHVDCEHDLMQLDMRADRAIIACNTNANVAGRRRLRGYQWTEVLDFTGRTRYRTTKAFEPRIADDGTVAAVTRSQPATLVAIDLPE